MSQLNATNTASATSATIGGMVSLLFGFVQFAYGALALIAGLFIEVLGFGWKVARKSEAALPEETTGPVVTKELVTAIGIMGILLAIVCLVLGLQSIYRRHLPRTGLLFSVAGFGLLAYLHHVQGMEVRAIMYTGSIAVLLIIVLTDYFINPTHVPRNATENQ